MSQEGTSNKKYASNKYEDLSRLDSITRKMFLSEHNRIRALSVSNSVNAGRARNRSAHQQKSAHGHRATQQQKSQQRGHTKPIRGNKDKSSRNSKSHTIDNYEDDLIWYKQLCLDLRKQNTALKKDLQQSKINNASELAEVQQKIKKLSDKCQQKTSKVVQSHRNDWKDWCGSTVQCLQQIEPKLKKKFRDQKSVSGKIMLSRCVMSQISQFLLQKDFKLRVSLL